MSKIAREYIEYTNVFSSDLVIKLPDNTEVKENAIEFVKGK